MFKKKLKGEDMFFFTLNWLLKKKLRGYPSENIFYGWAELRQFYGKNITLYFYLSILFSTGKAQRYLSVFYFCFLLHKFPSKRVKHERV